VRGQCRGPGFADAGNRQAGPVVAGQRVLLSPEMNDRQPEFRTWSCPVTHASNGSINRTNQSIRNICLLYSVSSPKAACEHLAKSFGIG
jgi:hypothetical protein